MSRLSPLPACAALDSLFPLWKHSRLFQTSSDRSVNRSTIRAEQRFANGTRGPSLESSNGRLVWAGQKPSISYSTRSAKAAQGLRQGHEKERPPRSPRRSLTPSARGTGGEEEEAIMNTGSCPNRVLSFADGGPIMGSDRHKAVMNYSSNSSSCHTKVSRVSLEAVPRSIASPRIRS